VLRASDEPPTALGGGGGLLGYGGLNRSLAIELDTWHNSDMGDLYYNHVSISAAELAQGAHYRDGQLFNVLAG